MEGGRVRSTRETGDVQFERWTMGRRGRERSSARRGHAMIARGSVGVGMGKLDKRGGGGCRQKSG